MTTSITYLYESSMYFRRVAGFWNQEGQNVMSARTLEQWVKPLAGEPAESSPGRLQVVVGFDGSRSADRALDAATRLISGRPGSIVVVYVAHMSTGAELSPEAVVESLKGFDALEHQLTDTIRGQLDGVEPRWSFQRRDGIIARELLAAAEEVNRDHGHADDVVIVVGGALRTYHHLVGSVPVALVRHAKYPIVVVP
jgi:nucleotide-binding universal stress UspA family protein